MATIKETLEFKALDVNNPYNLSFSLNQFKRASILAPNFKWYKAVKVEWTFQPLFNVYQEGVAIESVPYMYTRMNRTQDSVGITLQTLQAMGAKPVKFTSKKTLTYVPNWCSPGLSTYINDGTGNVLIGSASMGLKPEYGYLASTDGPITNINADLGLLPIDPRLNAPINSGMNSVYTNAVSYNGTDIYFDQTFSSVVGTNRCCNVQCTVTWSFKDPNYHTFIRDVPPVEPLV